MAPLVLLAESPVAESPVESTESVPEPVQRATHAGTDFNDRNVICRHCGNTALVDVAAFSTPSLYPECCGDAMALPSIAEVDAIRSGKRGVVVPKAKCSGCSSLHPLRDGAYCRTCKRKRNREWMRARRAEGRR